MLMINTDYTHNMDAVNEVLAMQCKSSTAQALKWHHWFGVENYPMMEWLSKVTGFKTQQSYSFPLCLWNMLGLQWAVDSNYQVPATWEQEKNALWHEFNDGTNYCLQCHDNWIYKHDQYLQYNYMQIRNKQLNMHCLQNEYATCIPSSGDWKNIQFQ
jgi:hypothetical protein